MMSPASYEFVMQEGPKGFSKVTQKKIRRQAMMAVAAARRQSGRYGKHNLCQHAVSHGKAESELAPIAVPIGDRSDTRMLVVHRDKGLPRNGVQKGPDEDQSANERVSYLSTEETMATALNKLRTSMFYSELELFLMDFSVEPADLSALTCVHVASAVRNILTTQPDKLKDVLSSRQRSYFEHLYSRFGQAACLDDAIRCLIMVAQDLLAPSARTSQRAILAQYGRALESLQRALNDQHKWADPDTLCATKLLQLFSVLYPAACSPDTWSHHLLGSTKLLELKGPNDFKTDYEKSLFMDVIATMVAEAFYQNQVSFLEQPAWQETVRACIVETDLFSDRSPLAIELVTLIVKMPGVCKRVGDVVCGIDSSPNAISTVRHEVQQLRRELRRWRSVFDAELVASTAPCSIPASRRNKRLDTLANALIFQSLLARLAGSIQAWGRFLTEEEILQNCAYIARIEETCMARDYRTAFYMEQKQTVAASLLETSHLWRDPYSTGDLIEAWKFRTWCDAVPRLSPRTHCSVVSTPTSHQLNLDVETIGG